MQTKVHHNNLLGNKKIFDNSAELLPPLSSTLRRASQGIQSLLNSEGEGGNTTNDLDLGVSSEKIIEDYDGQRRNIFSISSGAGARLELSAERPGGGRGRLESCVRMMFNEFCETTGLHGWKYLTRVSQITQFSHKTPSLLACPHML